MELFEVPVKDLTFDQLQLLKVSQLHIKYNYIHVESIFICITVFVLHSLPIEQLWLFKTTKVKNDLVF